MRLLFVFIFVCVISAPALASDAEDVYVQGLLSRNGGFLDRLISGSCDGGSCGSGGATLISKPVQKYRETTYNAPGDYVPPEHSQAMSSSRGRIIPGLIDPLLNLPTAIHDRIEGPQEPNEGCRINELEERLDIIIDKLNGLEIGVAGIGAGVIDLGVTVTEASDTQGQIAAVLVQLAQGQTDTGDKLDAALALLTKPTEPIDMTITVAAPDNLPASYVNTSTAWAASRKTGLSHAVLVINSQDADWGRLSDSYNRARSKFPNIQLVDVHSAGLKISPTPQLVLYYTEADKAPEIISGNRDVGAKLHDFYSS